MHREWRFFLAKALQIGYRETTVVAIVVVVAAVVTG